MGHTKERLLLRPQIRCFKSVAERDAEALRLLSEAAAQKARTIAFLSTVQMVKDWRTTLKGKKLVHSICHEQLDRHTREREATGFIRSQVNIMLGTLAFGMGIDLEYVSRTIHIGLPYSLEDLLQQIGGVGRDGEFADCYVLFTQEDLDRAERIGLGGIPSFKQIASLLEYLHRSASVVRLRINGYPGLTLRSSDYIGTRTDGNPIMEAQLTGAFAALEEFKIVERNGHQYTLKYTPEELDNDKTPLTRAAHQLTVGAQRQRSIVLAYLVTTYAGKEVQDTYDAIFGHLKGETLTARAHTWWEERKESAYQQVLKTALTVLHQQDMTVNKGLNAYLRGKSQHQPAIHFAELTELSPRIVDWAISRLEDEGMLRRIIGPVPILALSQKGLDWVKANQGALPMALIDSRSVTKRIHHPESTKYLQRLFTYWVTDAANDAPDGKFARESFWDKRVKVFLDMRFEVEDKRLSGGQIIVSYWRLQNEAEATPSLALKMLHELFPEQVPQLQEPLE